MNQPQEQAPREKERDAPDRQSVTDFIVRGFEAFRGPHTMEQLSKLFLDITERIRRKREGVREGEQEQQASEVAPAPHAAPQPPAVNQQIVNRQLNQQLNQQIVHQQVINVAVVANSIDVHASRAPADTASRPLTAAGNLEFPPRHVSRKQEPQQDRAASERLDREQRHELALVRGTPRRGRSR